MPKINQSGKQKLIQFLKTHEYKLSTGQNVPTCFFTIKDVMDIFDAEPIRIENLFRSKGFPVCTIGKSKIVEVHAFLNFWQMHPEIATGPVQFAHLKERRLSYGNT